ncbi:unnamed protein product [Cuscuta campestris]|uniref:Uncharacterized protein n=1 Tax=Cuscuta campestris TaxID=132261 RepID=A0A484MQ70_9ASTE|nr:unnamed protein product [Cuscuta campestris]
MHKLEMNRSFRNSVTGGGMNFPLASHHRRGLSLNGASNCEASDDSLDLFSKSRRSLSAASSDDSDGTVPVKLGRLSVGSVIVGKNGSDDLLSSSEEGKHDYDWLLTPPGTPLPSSNVNEPQPGHVALASRSRPLARSVSASKPSRLSVSHSENSSQPTRPTRSSSVTRPSISSSQYNNYSNKSSNNILNTSSASVSSYIRQSTPTRSSSSARPSTTTTSRPTLSRPSTPPRGHPSLSTGSRPSQSSRPSTPTSRPQITSSMSSSAPRSTTSRPSTPTRRNSFPPSTPPRGHPSLSTGSRPSQSSRPSTPTSRPQITSSMSSSAPRSTTSRPSTPTRRNSFPSVLPTPSSGRTVSNGRNVGSVSRPSSPARSTASVSRPSSPGPPIRRTPQPIVLPDFSLETPSNLRTSLPDRPLSVGRSRPGAPLSGKGAMDIPNAGNPPRRQPSPSGRVRVVGNGHSSDASDPGRVSHGSKLPQRKSVRTPTESVGFGGTISKKSLDVAIRHMDIRNGPNGARAISGSTLFPPSIRSNGTKKQQQVHGSSSPASLSGSMNSNNSEPILEKGSSNNGRPLENRSEEEERHERPSLTRVTDGADVYESCRYDMLLLKEDVKNTNWLHSIDDKSEATMFDNGFEPLPEPFDPLLQ